MGEGVGGDVETKKLKGVEFAEMVGVTSGYLSRAARNDWLAKNVRPRQYAVLHWKGEHISHYEVPKELIKDLVPSYRWSDYGISRY